MIVVLRRYDVCRTIPEPLRSSLRVRNNCPRPRRRHRPAQQDRLGRAARALRRPLPGRPRRLDDRRRASVDPCRPRHVDQLAPVGRERLRARLWRLPPPRRPRCRPARQAPHVPDLARRLRRRVRPRRARERRHAARHHPLHQGRQRRLHRARRTVDHHDVVRRGPGAQQGPVDLHRNRRHRLLARPRLQRAADRDRLAVGVPVPGSARADRAPGGHPPRARRQRRRAARRAASTSPARSV